MGIGRTTAFSWIKGAMAQITLESAEELLKLELDRLDYLQQQVYAEIMAGTGGPSAIDTMLKIMDRRARYLGLWKDSAAAGGIHVTVRPMSPEALERDKPILRPDGPIPANVVL
jgi:hypothetical protein